MPSGTASPGTALLTNPAELKRLRKRLRCQSDYRYFVGQFWEEVPGAGKLIGNWHIDYLCAELQKIAFRVWRGEVKDYDLCCNVSPGTSKSTLFSILFHPWTWTFFPQSRHINASHTETLVLDLATKARAVIESEKYQELFPEIELRYDQATKGYYANTLGGDRLSCTVGGKTPTGFHAHFLGLDDPLDPQKAVSDLELKNAENFTLNVLPTRMVDKSVSTMFQVAQRLSERDPTGVMMRLAEKEDGTPVKLISIPAELIHPDKDRLFPAHLRGKYVDGLMDVNRLTRRVLKGYRARGEQFYASQFLQSPTPLGGGMFKDFYFRNHVRAAPHDARRVRYWDLASTCLIAGTLIETSEGEVPIEAVREGDRVLTRQGYRRVKWSGKTGEVSRLVSVTFANGSVVTATPEHKVWTENRGWVDIASIRDSDYTLYITRRGSKCRSDAARSGSPTRNSLNSTASSTRDVREKSISRQTGGTGTGNVTGRIPCTGRYGDIISATSPTGMMSITRTAIGTTITSPIWVVSPVRNTASCTPLSRNGTRRRRRRSFAEETFRRDGSGRSTGSTNANFAVRSFAPAPSVESPFIVPRLAVGGTISESRLASVPSADDCFTDAPERFAVPTFVPRDVVLRNVLSAARNFSESSGAKSVAECPAVPSGVGGVDVYDLEVEDAHEFFANGILVHNSNGGCWTVGVLLARDAEGAFYVEHAERGQWEPHERNRRIRGVASRDRLRYGPHHEPMIYVERQPAAAGKDLWLGIVRSLAGHSVREHDVSRLGDKEKRADPWSVQLAGGNVHLVVDGTWDASAYVQEHLSFPNGMYLDQVDASSGAFNVMANMTRNGPLMRTYSFSDKGRKHGPEILVCDESTLAVSTIDSRSILIAIREPGGPNHEEVTQVEARVRDEGDGVNNRCALVELSGEGVVCSDQSDRRGADVSPGGRLLLPVQRQEGVDGGVSEETSGSKTQPGERTPPLPQTGEAGTTSSNRGDRSSPTGLPLLPPHGCSKLLDSVVLEFADVDPKDHQQTWSDIIPEYGRCCEEVMMTREHAKAVWRVLTKKRDPQHQTIVIVGQKDVALSIAYAVSDVLGLKRRIMLIGQEERSHDGKPANDFIYQQTKQGRQLVV